MAGITSALSPRYDPVYSVVCFVRVHARPPLVSFKTHHTHHIHCDALFVGCTRYNLLAISPMCSVSYTNQTAPSRPMKNEVRHHHHQPRVTMIQEGTAGQHRICASCIGRRKSESNYNHLCAVHCSPIWRCDDG